MILLRYYIWVMDNSNQTVRSGQISSAAFLLSQVGAFAAGQFAARLEPLSLNPGDVGILRLIAAETSLSQQGLANRLGVAPSRVVVLIDALEKNNLVARERSARDRRTYELHLTDEGRAVMKEMRTIGSSHEAEITAALSAVEREELIRLLEKIASSHDLTPKVHPGYRAQDTTNRGGTRQSSQS